MSVHADGGWPAGGGELITVDACFHQYYVHDESDFPDWTGAEGTADGVLAPLALGTGVVILTGAMSGNIRVEVVFTVMAPPLPPPGVVAAECDVDLPSGTIAIAGWSGEKYPYLHTWGHPTRVRLRAQMYGRDLLSRDGSDERHTLLIWETKDARPRWRSGTADQAAGQLTQPRHT